MSDPTRDWKMYANDMMTYARKAIHYTGGLTQSEFVASELVYDATLRNIELIGEAASHIPEAIRLQSPNLPWRQIIATRSYTVIWVSITM